MKMNNLPVDVKISSLCSKETLVTAEVQKYKWKLRPSLFLIHFYQTCFDRYFSGGSARELLPRGVLCRGIMSYTAKNQNFMQDKISF